MSHDERGIHHRVTRYTSTRAGADAGQPPTTDREEACLSASDDLTERSTGSRISRADAAQNHLYMGTWGMPSKQKIRETVPSGVVEASLRQQLL